MLNRAFFIWLPLSNTKMARGVWGIRQMPHNRAAQAVASESEIGWAVNTPKNALRTRF